MTQAVYEPSREDRGDTTDMPENAHDVPDDPGGGTGGGDQED
jgi:hypothetical protein